MGKLGDDFDRSAIDQIGREVDANLVVHVYIESATLYPEPGLLQPRAVIQIKVIDAINRRRLFPTIGRADGRSEFAVPSRGKRLEVRLSPRASAGESSTVQAMMMRRLSLRIARDAARLFYDYQPRQPGQRFE
jgi:hypothetical protein